MSRCLHRDVTVTRTICWSCRAEHEVCEDCGNDVTVHDDFCLDPRAAV